MSDIQDLKPAIAELETAVQAALANGDDSTLDVMGYGEISVVLGLETDDAKFACKRLPAFESQQRLDNYTQVFYDYLAALRDAGVNVIQSELVSVKTIDGIVAYCIQPALESSQLGPNLMGTPSGDKFLTRAIAATKNAISNQVGIDAQLSNWAMVNDELIYIDVTTPFLRDAHGVERLDLELFLASLPWLLRAVVRKFLIKEILVRYYEPRTCVLDLIANMIKEGFDAQVDAALRATNEWAEPKITEAEVRKYYKSDARTWALLQRARRLDKFWQRRIRRRTYPFLLPGPIKR